MNRSRKVLWLCHRMTAVGEEEARNLATTLGELCSEKTLLVRTYCQPTIYKKVFYTTLEICFTFLPSTTKEQQMNTMNITPMVDEWHYLVINENRCVRGQKLRPLMAEFDKGGLSYCVWLVPCSQTDPYHINHDRPQIKGAFVLEYVDFEVGEVA